MPVPDKIRKFRWNDLEEWTGLFNVVQGTDQPDSGSTVEYMRRFLSPPLCDPEEDCYIAESNGSLVGFVLMSVELPIGRVVASGGVLPSHRGRGIGRALTERAIDHATGLQADCLHIQVPDHNLEGRHLLHSLGFHPVRHYWRLLWEQGATPRTNVPLGFSLRPFKAGLDEVTLTNLQNAAFADHWGFCPNTVDEITARVQLRPWGAAGIVFLLDGQTPAAYNWTSTPSSASGVTGKIEMTGVHPDYRGRSLGRMVVLAGMDHLKRNGVDRIELEVDLENTPARALYLSLGFRKVMETTWYERTLPRQDP